MVKEKTLSIIKPDAVGKHHIGDIISRFEKSGLEVVGMKMMHLSQKQAEGFYAVHKERPFFKDLVKFMITGPVVVMVLEGDNAVTKNRDIMGATDPQKATHGTIRKDFAKTIDENAVHGSDSADNAKKDSQNAVSDPSIISSISRIMCCWKWDSRFMPSILTNCKGMRSLCVPPRMGNASPH